MSAPVMPERCVCGKINFPDDVVALKELAKITRLSMLGVRRRDVDGYIETGVYQCPRSGWWHLTSRPVSGQIARPLEVKT